MNHQKEIRFDINFLKKHVKEQQLLKGTFGLERESLRVTKDGKLAMTPHPDAFGNKMTNPFITTDFSESQVEMITPVCMTVDEAYTAMTNLCHFVEDALPEEEYLWPQSMPCIIPEDDKIPIAHYTGDSQKAEESMVYRRRLMKKYCGKKQLISGIHYNFGLDEETLQILFDGFQTENPDQGYSWKWFKDQVYLKMIRGYLRYRWLIVYLAGCSAGFHESFMPKPAEGIIVLDDSSSFLKTTAPSFRNSVYGYKNPVPLFPDYYSVDAFAEDVRQFVSEGLISAPKELYTQIRMKAKNSENLLDSLNQDGIQYLEIRTIDLNVYDRCGISKQDMTFMHHFLLWLLTVPEAKNADWQEEALHNEELTALYGFDPECTLYCDGKPVRLKKWAEYIFRDILEMEEALGLDGEKIIQEMEDRVKHPEKTAAAALMYDIRESGFLDFHMEKACFYKDESARRSRALASCADCTPEIQEKIRVAVTSGDIKTLEELKEENKGLLCSLF